MATALVIGLGTSGLHIIEECQQFHYQFTGKNRPKSVRYLYLETDITQKSKTTALGQSDIQPVYISLQNILANVNRLKEINKIDHTWIPEPDDALAAGNGAGGNSSYGRLALWINYSKVRSEILQYWREINGDQNTYIFIVGTLTGGTGSGTCVDMAYLVRDITNSGNIFGLFLTPSRQQLAQGGSNSLFYNYFSAITAIQYYSRNPFRVTWPDGNDNRNEANAYKQCYFLSQDYANNYAPIASVTELYRVAGLHIFSRIHSFGEVNAQNGDPLPNFSTTIDARLLDNQQNRNAYKFATFGTKLIYFPKELLTELFGLKLSKQILNQLIDTDYYTDNNLNLVPILTNSVTIIASTKLEFEKLIIDCLSIVNGQNTANNRNFVEEIENKNVKEILSKDYTASNTSAYIYSLFTSNNDANHFALVNNYRFEICNQFINKIYELVKTKLEIYKNLSVCILVLEAIVESIEDVLKFWKDEYGLDGQRNTWNTVLQAQIRKIASEKRVPTLLIQQKLYFKEQLINILMLCKMQVSIETLEKIKKDIQTASIGLRSQTAELPTINKVNTIISLVRNVINNPDAKNETQSIQRRENEIRSNLTNQTPNFTAVFPKSSLDKYIEGLENDYTSNFQNERFSASHITNKQLWIYLEKIDKSQLFMDCIIRSSEYVRSYIEDLQNQSIINLITDLRDNRPGDAQWQAIRQFITENRNNIRMAIPGLEVLRNIDVFTEDDDFLNLIYLNGNIRELSALIPHYDITEANCNCELVGLNEAIIIYQEYGIVGNACFDPTVNIGINSAVSRSIADNIDYEGVDDNNNPNKFLFKRRIPYLTRAQFAEYLPKVESIK